MCYQNDLRFEISNAEKDIDVNGHNWWEQSGVIVSIGGELYIRAIMHQQFGIHHINIQTGAVLSEKIPKNMWTFGVWSLWVRDPIRERNFQLVEFKVHKPD